MTPEEKRAKRIKGIKKRVIGYGGVIALFSALYWYQPLRFDLVERKPATPNPILDPDTAKLFAKGTKILLITAHPDDSEFYIGGTLDKLSKTAEIYQIICTDGDKAYYGPFADSDSLRKVRREEAVSAMKAWNGKSVTFLGYPDGRLFVTDKLVEQIVAKINEVQPDYIFAFDGDFPPRASHRDHRNSGIAAQLAAKKAGVGEWLMMYSTNGENYVDDVTDNWDAKERYLAIHKSQFAKKQDGINNMVAGFAERDGERIGVALGEGFRCVRVKDL